MWQLTVFFTYSLLAISHSTELIFVKFFESPYQSAKCMDGPKCCSKSEYRSIDGSCNNLKRPEWGMPNRPYGRLIDYNYADGRHELPTMLSGKPLPSARTVSHELFRTNNKIDPKYTLLTMQHGQLVAHDMSLTADGPQIGVKVHPVVCCSGGKLGPDASNTERCAAIEISPDDPDFGPFNISCFDFTRTATTYDRGCAGPDEVAKPISAVTSWMDLSVVYGSSEKQAKAIRSFECGTLLSVIRNGQEWPPQQENVTKSCPATRSAKEPCYKGGDVRMNQNPGLTTLQVIWLREHNRIALTLCETNPHWDDETLYQEARRITIAEYQHITYTEYLPIILGKKYMVKEKMLFPYANKCVNDYDSSMNPSVTDEHANGGAFRNFHSAIIGYLQLLDEKRKTTGLARLSDWMNRPLILEANTTVNLDHLVRGMITQYEQFIDQYVDEEISRDLFRGKRQRGFDLRSLDIQRSRDHGMGTYVQARKYCGLRLPKNFIDLQRICGISKENAKILKKLYERVEDIELPVGGALEPLLPGTLSGETFHCILMDTFKRARRADRFWYQNCEDDKFTTEQLQTIQQSSMSRIFCDNSEIEYIQPRSFEAISEQNKLASCKSYTPLFVHYWCEQEYVPLDHSTIDEIEVQVDLEYHPNRTHDIYVLRLDKVPVVDLDGIWN